MPEDEKDVMGTHGEPHKGGIPYNENDDPAHKAKHMLLRKPVTSPWVKRNLAGEQHSHEIESHD